MSRNNRYVITFTEQRFKISLGNDGSSIASHCIREPFLRVLIWFQEMCRKVPD